MSAKGVCFLIRYLEWIDDGGQARPVEFARVVFRADAVELGLTLA